MILLLKLRKKLDIINETVDDYIVCDCFVKDIGKEIDLVVQGFPSGIKWNSDSVILELEARGKIKRIEVDTMTFLI